MAGKTSHHFWHKRLGHPSDNIVQLLPFIGFYDRKFIKTCDIYPRAKQSREKFTLSKNK